MNGRFMDGYCPKCGSQHPAGKHLVLPVCHVCHRAHLRSQRHQGFAGDFIPNWKDHVPPWEHHWYDPTVEAPPPPAEVYMPVVESPPPRKVVKLKPTPRDRAEGFKGPDEYVQLEPDAI